MTTGLTPSIPVKLLKVGAPTSKWQEAPFLLFVVLNQGTRWPRQAPLGTAKTQPVLPPPPRRVRVMSNKRKYWINRARGTRSSVTASVVRHQEWVPGRTHLSLLCLDHLPDVPCSSRGYIRLLHVNS
ncbi:hypothetical protein HPB47_023551 [Ixodes persulcatus]|uniref:Uncharacterized protein n=1 Tax=Ixodes persulcatus TaxID=34615 RepID=A0AC60Q8M7_IXOPE|nr:hypothetical protein HPB47_023551 [Ixodes persulcatus]